MRESCMMACTDVHIIRSLYSTVTWYGLDPHMGFFVARQYYYGRSAIWKQSAWKTCMWLAMVLCHSLPMWLRITLPLCHWSSWRSHYRDRGSHERYLSQWHDSSDTLIQASVDQELSGHTLDDLWPYDHPSTNIISIYTYVHREQVLR